MTPCQVLGFLTIFDFFILSEVKNKYSFKMLKTRKGVSL
jgi:hypothetical protein